LLFRNTVAQTASLITGYVFSFILAPIMLARLGLAQFGVWAVTGAFATYAGLMDLGITRALGRFIAFHHAQRDRRSVEQCFTLGLIAVSCVVLLAGTAAVFAAGIVAGALDHILTTGEMRIVLLSSVAISGLNAFKSVLRAVPEGMERFVPPNVAEVGFNTTNFTFSLAALVLSRELVPYALANVAAGVVGVGFAAAAARSVTGPLRVRIPHRPLVKEVMGFAVQNQLAWIADLAAGQAAKIMIALFLDVRVAGAYEIANRAVVAAKSVAVMSVSAMVPTATARITTEGRGIIADFYRRYTTRALSVSLPVLVLLCAGAPALLTTWLGTVPPNSMGIFIALTLANCVNLTTGVAYALALGEGRAGMIAAVSAFTALLTVGSMALLVQAFDVWGVVAGGVLGIVVGALVYLVHFHQAHGLPPRDYLRSVGLPAGVTLLAAAPLALSWLVLDAPDGRLPALLLTVVDVLVFVGIYWPLASRLDLLPEKLRASHLRRVLTRRREPAPVA
jgi:O-antigen/teichoic acid export membrane protein